MERKVRLGAGVFVLLGIIYTALGGIFDFLGVSFLVAGTGEIRLTGTIFAGIGSLFLVLGILFLVLEFRKKKRAEKLLASGRYLWAEVIDCIPNVHVSINHRHPYLILAEYVDAQGNHHIFKSRTLKIYRDPGLTGKQVKVYYEDRDFRHYHMDVDPILPRYMEH